MDQECVLTIEESPNPDDENFVYEGLRRYNSQYVGDYNRHKLVILLRDPSKAIVGGLLGDTYWGWLYVSILWIQDAYRRRGYGRAMLNAAEQEALRRGCQHVHLDTMDFQALPFYQKLGYGVFGELRDMPPGHTRYFLQKALKVRAA